MRVFLVGFPLCGKTTVGRRLAKLLDLQFLDTDSVFEQRYLTTIPQYFLSHTQEEFRKSERELLISLLKEDNCVISTGGGLPCFYDNMDLILQNGISVYLHMAEASILVRLKKSKRNRPLLRLDSDEETLRHIHELLTKREPFYRRANIIIKAEDLKAKSLADIINKEYGGKQASKE